VFYEVSYPNPNIENVPFLPNLPSVPSLPVPFLSVPVLPVPFSPWILQINKIC